jgi:L-histidine N-alpha-methyltransferase
MPRSAASRPDDGFVALADEIARSLTQSPRQLPSHYLYDRLGSSLFEAICRLPWYRVAVVEQRLLDRHAERIFAQMGPVTSVVELGPGSGEKLATLISARTVRNVRVHLVDVSPEALDRASRTLGALPDLSVVTHQATYEAGLASVGRHDGAPGSSLVVFLGSNIGNFDKAAADALLLAIRAAVRRGDSLLLGADLVKPERELELAYDDPLGVTAAFNRNLLVRLNRELGSDFDVDGFVHRARWNADQARVEMHLVSTRRQRVRIPTVDLDITFEDGETIWTESSYKYRVGDLAAMLTRAGFRVTGQWVDDGFALTLGEAE